MLFQSVSLSIAFWIVFLTGLRLTVAPPEGCGQDNEAAIRNAAVLAAEWMTTNQWNDGTYVYIYNARTDETPGSYNEVRHAGVTMALYQAAGHLGDTEALSTADRGLAWMQDHLERRHGWAALVIGGDRAQLGASALMLVGLAERRLATHDTQYDGLMNELGTFIREQQRDDGGFYVAWQFDTDGPDTVGTSRYYPGEALWALALMHEAFPDAGYEQPARRALQFITTLRDEVEGVEFPPLADQWAAYGIGEMVEWGLTDQQADYARRLAARFGLLVRTESQREGSWFGQAARGRKVRGAGIGTWEEGLAALWRASRQDERLADLSDPIVERLRCMGGIMADRQVTPEEAQRFASPEHAAGAWFRDGETRMDDMQHVFSGLIYTLDAMAGNPVREPQQTVGPAE